MFHLCSHHLSMQLLCCFSPEPSSGSLKWWSAFHLLVSIQVTFSPGVRYVCWPPGSGSAWTSGKGDKGQMSLSSDRAASWHTLDCSACGVVGCQFLPLLTNASQSHCPCLFGSSAMAGLSSAGPIDHFSLRGMWEASGPKPHTTPSSIPARDCLPSERKKKHTGEVRCRWAAQKPGKEIHT